MSRRLFDKLPSKRLSSDVVAALAVLGLSGWSLSNSINWSGNTSGASFGEGEYDLAITCPPHYKEDIEAVNLVQSDYSDITVDCRLSDKSKPPLRIRQVHPPLVADNLVIIGYDYGENGKQHPQMNIDVSDGVVGTISLSGISEVTYVDQSAYEHNLQG